MKQLFLPIYFLFVVTLLHVHNSVILASAQSVSGFVGSVTTLAGTRGLIGDNTNSTPRNALTAQLISPTSIVGGGDGSLLFADVTSIRNISNGLTWVVAGQRRTSGFIDGPVATALLAGPSGLRIANNTVYFCDSPNNAIRILKNSVVSTVAGSRNGTGGFVNGQNALFNKPVDLDFGPDGSIFVADNANDAIRRIYPNGTTSTVFSVGGLQPKAVKTSPTFDYVVIGGVINSIDTIIFYYFGNSTWTAIATSPAATNSFDFDDNGDILFAAQNAFYVLYKDRSWARALIVGGGGSTDGEYPAITGNTVPSFSGIQAFSRIRGTLYAFAEASPNFLVRTMTIIPQYTPTLFTAAVAVPNIPTNNATVLAAIINAVYLDFIALTKYSYNVSTSPTLGASTATGTGFTFSVPAFLSNYTTRLNMNLSFWNNTRAITDAFYSNKTIALSFPATGMPIDPYNPTNATAIRLAQLAALDDLIRITGYGSGGLYTAAPQYNISASTNEVIFYFSVPGPIYNDTTTALLKTNNFTAAAAFVQYYNSYHPLSLTFPDPLLTAANGGQWPTGNATAMKDLALLIVNSLANLTGTGNSGFTIMNVTLSDDGLTSNAGTITIPVNTGSSVTYFVVNAATGTISIKGTIRGPLENQTTTTLLQQNYLTAFNGNPAAAANVLAYVEQYNANSTLNLFFDTPLTGLPLSNATYLASVVAAFNLDIQKYFATSPLYQCCVHASSNYSFVTIASGAATGTADQLVFSATIPGSYHNASLNAAFASRILSSSAVFFNTLTALNGLNAPTPVQLAFGLQPGPVAYNGITPDMNFPTDNATAMSSLIVPALAADIKAMLGGNNNAVSVGSPAFRIVASPTRTIYLNISIPRGAYNSTTNAIFAANSASIDLAASATAPIVATEAVEAAIAASYPNLAAALNAYYETKTITVYFGPAGNFPLWVDPVASATTTTTDIAIPTFILTGNTTTADPSETTSTSTAPPPTISTATTTTTTVAATVDSRMASIYAALLKDIMGTVVYGNIIYPTDPNTWNASLVPVSAVRDDTLKDYQYMSRVIFTTAYDNATNTSTTTNRTVVYIGLRVRVPGPYYNATTQTDLSASTFPSLNALISETVTQNVSFSPLSRWPLTNATRMAQLRQLLVLDAMTYFNYTGEYMALDDSIDQPIIVNASGSNTGSVTWRFKVPVVSYASTSITGSTPLPSRLPSYSFPRTSAALDDANNNVVTPWRGMAPEPTFFSDSCGQGCVIGIAIAVAIILVILAIIVVVVVSKRKRRADVVSPNFNPVMNGKIDID